MGDKVTGEAKTIPIMQPTARIERAATSSVPIPAKKADGAAPNKIKDLNNAMKNCSVKTPDCKQILWFSFFFDGTGNNLVADLPSREHTNVTRLFRAHAGDGYVGKTLIAGAPSDAKRTFRIYIPGIGTYFNEVNDPGGEEYGLAIGQFGQARLNWANKQFDQLIVGPMALAKNNPANEIIEINIAAFGFSRGAAAARAFINDFVSTRCKKDSSVRENGLQLKELKCTIRIRFMGLFDTVASVGPGASANVIKATEARAPLAVKLASRYAKFPDSKPSSLAFSPNGEAGAKPADGMFNGHAGFGDLMHIPDEVEKVFHFIAGHEIRNSFPVDSISIFDESTRTIPPRKNFFEYVHGGVHSDVGGGYRPGEGGKNEAAETKLGIFFLRKMYSYALSHGVPLLAETAWTPDNVSDFHISSKVYVDYEYYLSQVKAGEMPIGDQIRAHMRLYYQWRFHVIRKAVGKNSAEQTRIARTALEFSKEQARLDKEIALLTAKSRQADKYLQDLKTDKAIGFYPLDYFSKSGIYSKDYPAKIQTARLKAEKEQDDLRQAQARLLTLPKETGLSSVIELYDRQLLIDVADIVGDQPGRSKNAVIPSRTTLRPHYKMLLEAYENERDGKGMTDQKLIAFFDTYIHNSLAAFGLDATLPSDPRIVYAGKNNRLLYAQTDDSKNADTIT